MVINPECDLAFTPDDKRLPNVDDSILFVPGKLEPLTEPVGSTAGPRTEPFVHGNKHYRIVWAPKRLRTVPHGRVHEEITSTGFVRVARLRLPFALEIQHDIASGMSRPGMPIAPPRYRPLRATIYRRAVDGTVESVSVPDGAEAFCVESRDAKGVIVTHCRLNGGMLRALKQQVGAYVANAGERVEGSDSGGVASRREPGRPKKGWGEKARTSQESYESWRDLAQPFRCEKDKTFEGASVSVVRKAREHGDRWRDQTILVVFVDDFTAVAGQARQQQSARKGER
jgi:hypothetical protein